MTTQWTQERALEALPELLAIVERLAALSDGLNAANSSAELAAATLAYRAKKLMEAKQ